MFSHYFIFQAYGYKEIQLGRTMLSLLIMLKIYDYM